MTGATEEVTTMLTHQFATDLAADRMCTAEATAARERIRRSLRQHHAALDAADVERTALAQRSGRRLPVPPATPVRVL